MGVRPQLRENQETPRGSSLVPENFPYRDTVF